MKAGKVEEAVPVLLSLVSGFREHQGLILNATRCLSLLGQAYRITGRVEEASAALREALAACEAAPSRDAAWSELEDQTRYELTLLQSAAAGDGCQMQWAEAEAALRKMLEERRRRLGAEHPLAVEALRLLLAVLLKQRKSAEAHGVLVIGAAEGAGLFGESVAACAEELRLLAQQLAARGRRSEAEAYLRQVVVVSRHTLAGKAGAGVEVCPALMAEAYCELGELLRVECRLTEAEGVLLEGFSLSARALGAHSDPVLRIAGALGATLLGQGKARDAELLCRGIVAAAPAGTAGAAWAELLRGFAAVLWETGKGTESVDRLAQAHQALRQAAPGAQAGASPECVRLTSGLAVRLRAVGRPADSAEVAERSLAATSAALGEGHVAAMDARFSLALALLDLGRPAAAEAHLTALLPAVQAAHAKANKAAAETVAGALSSSPTGVPSPPLAASSLLMAMAGALENDAATSAAATAALVSAQRSEERERWGLDADCTADTVTLALVRALRLRADPAEAQALLLPVATALRKRHGDAHAETLKAMATLGAVMLDLGHASKSRLVLEKVLTGARLLLEGTAGKAQAQAQQGQQLRSQRSASVRPEDQKLKRSLRPVTETLPCAALLPLAWAFEVSGDLRKAELALQASLAQRGQDAAAVLPRPWDVLVTRADLGRLKRLQGDAAAAVEMLGAAHAGLDAAVGAAHPATLRAKADLAVALAQASADNAPRALQLAQEAVAALGPAPAPPLLAPAGADGDPSAVEGSFKGGAEAIIPARPAPELPQEAIWASIALGEVLLCSGDATKAEHSLARTAAEAEAWLGATHPLTSLANIKLSAATFAQVRAGEITDGGCGHFGHACPAAN